MSIVRRHRLRLLALLVLLWFVVVAIRMGIDRSQPTPETIAQVLTKDSGMSPQAAMEEIASALRGMDIDERQRAMADPQLQTWFAALSLAEQESALARLQPPGWDEFVQGTARWTPGRYQRLLAPALTELEAMTDAAGQEASTDVARQIAEVGLATFLKQSSPSVRWENYPLLERLQRNSQMGR